MKQWLSLKLHEEPQENQRQGWLRYTPHTLGVQMKKREEKWRHFLQWKIQRISCLKEEKARNETRKKAKNYFLTAFLDLLGLFRLWKALLLGVLESGTVVTTYRIPMILGIVRTANILNFSVNRSTAQRGQRRESSGISLRYITQPVIRVWTGCSWHSIWNCTWKKK